MLLAAGVGPVAAQQVTSAGVTVTLVARKAATVSVLPSGTSALGEVTGPPPDAAAPALETAWNLPPTLVGELAWRTTSRRGAPYIERRVALLDPIARTRQPLDGLPAPDAVDPSRVVVVRLVVY